MDPASTNNASPPPAGLPPVQPPSARFIGQLFVIPGLIILVLVLLYIGSVMLVQRSHEPEYFLNQLDSDNADIRWRGLSDLAQILKRNEPAALKWKTDAKFALDLTQRLHGAYEELLKDEQKIADELAKSQDKNKDLAWRKLRAQRDYVNYLASAMGEFHVPVGAPVLCTIAKHDMSGDLKGNTLQRRKAVWALMNMGDNLKKFAKLPKENQDAALDVLRAEVRALPGSPRATCASTALAYLLPSEAPASGVVRVDETLVTLADADDRFLRELTAFAFNFWDGPRAEATLLKLAQDNGRGTLLRVEEND